MVPFMFQDDLVNGTEGLEQARETNRKVNCLVKERGLQLNKDKSVRKQVKSDPLMCGNFETKEVQVEKWLGQMFSAQGLAVSVAKTVGRFCQNLYREASVTETSIKIIKSS